MWSTDYSIYTTKQQVNNAVIMFGFNNTKNILCLKNFITKKKYLSLVQIKTPLFFLLKMFKNVFQFLLGFFKINKNVVFLDNNINLNYLPINNSVFFKNSAFKIKKILKYFNVGAVVYLDIKKIFFKKFLNLKVVTLSIGNKNTKQKTDFFLQNNSPIAVYIVYIYTLKLYIEKSKN